MDQDVNAQLKDLNDKLNQIQWMMSRVLAIIPSIVIGVDSKGCITQWNIAAERSFYIAAFQVIEHPFEQCGIQWDWELVNQHIKKAFNQSLPIHIDEIPYNSPNGGHRLLEMTLGSVARSNGSRSEVIIVANNLS